MRTISKKSKNNKFFQYAFNSTVTLALSIALISPAFSQQIVTDGMTNTSLDINGNNTTVTTSTIQGANAFNSFSKFNVDTGNIVNLVVPDSANNLINMVNGAPSNINGVLNSVKNGQIGGNVFLVNPYGVVVGSQGVINTGSLTTITPTKSFTDNFFTSPGNPNPDSVTALTSGAAPINTDASIVNNGTINVENSGEFIAGKISNSGFINGGAAFSDINDPIQNLAIGDIVNLNETGASPVYDTHIALVADEIVLSPSSGMIFGSDGKISINKLSDGNISISNNENPESSDLQLNAAELARLNSENVEIKNDKGDINIKDLDIQGNSNVKLFAGNWHDINIDNSNIELLNKDLDFSARSYINLDKTSLTGNNIKLFASHKLNAQDTKFTAANNESLRAINGLNLNKTAHKASTIWFTARAGARISNSLVDGRDLVGFAGRSNFVSDSVVHGGNSVDLGGVYGAISNSVMHGGNSVNLSSGIGYIRKSRVHGGNSVDLGGGFGSKVTDCKISSNNSVTIRSYDNVNIDRSLIESGGDVKIESAGDININESSIFANNDMRLQGRDLTYYINNVDNININKSELYAGGNIIATGNPVNSDPVLAIDVNSSIVATPNNIIPNAENIYVSPDSTIIGNVINN